MYASDYGFATTQDYWTVNLNGQKREKTTFLKKNRHKIRKFSFILLYLQCQKVKEAIYNRF